jgi:DUF2075 family protein
VVITTTSASQNSNWKFLFERAGKKRGGSGAVLGASAYSPVSTAEFGKLRKKYPDAFKAEVSWRDNLKMLRSLQPEFRSGSKDGEHLISIVDEAHALINPEHIEGRGQFGFTGAMGPQAYHIMRSSLITVFFLDPQQGFRDRENTTVSDIKMWAQDLGAELIDEISLGESQFRCAGSIEYVDAIQTLLDLPKTGELTDPGTAFPRPSEITAVARFAPFDLRMTSDLGELEELLRERQRQGFTVRFLASYARKWKTEGVALPHLVPDHLKDFNESFIRDGRELPWAKIWNYVPDGSDYTHFVQAPQGSQMFDDPLSEVGCPYAVRGFDFDYVGLLWLSDLKWRGGRWIADSEHIFERGINRLKKAARDERDPVGPHHLSLIRALKEAYRIILTRPLKGLYLWCEDSETRLHLENMLSIGQS